MNGEPREADPREGRSYNTIYEKLVDDDDEDLVGLIAYSLYKQSKREWLVEFTTHHGRRPSKEEEQVFVSGYTKKDLPRLRDQAERMLSAYAETVILNIRSDIEAGAEKAEIVRTVRDGLAVVERQNAWGRQMIAGAVGAFGYSILLLILFLVISLLGVDLLGLIERASEGASS